MRSEDQPSRTRPDVRALFVRAHGIGVAAGTTADAIYAQHGQLASFTLGDEAT